VTPDSVTTSGKTGFARLEAITVDAATATSCADLIMVTAPAMYHDVVVDALAPYLHDGQTVLFNTGYWGSLRQTVRLGRLPSGVTLAESNSMPYICHLQADAVQVLGYKRSFRLAAFPGERIDEVCALAKRVYEQYDPVPTLIDSNIAAGGNTPIHATFAIPVAGLYFDRYLGGKFYQDASTPGARLVAAHDAERERLALLDRDGVVRFVTTGER